MIWDNSASVGTKNFKDNVRPFLRKLIKNTKLNVGKDGTHIGFITFAGDKETKSLLKIGKIMNQKDLLSWLDGLNYVRDLIGSFTYTGKAFKLASEVRKPIRYNPD